MAEAVTLCITGGLVGVLLVLLLATIITNATDFHVMLSIKNFLLGIAVSAVVGILAGIIPAFSAARLDPVVAIRSN